MQRFSVSRKSPLSALLHGTFIPILKRTWKNVSKPGYLTEACNERPRQTPKHMYQNMFVAERETASL